MRRLFAALLFTLTACGHELNVAVDRPSLRDTTIQNGASLQGPTPAAAQLEVTLEGLSPSVGLQVHGVLGVMGCGMAVIDTTETLQTGQHATLVFGATQGADFVAAYRDDNGDGACTEGEPIWQFTSYGGLVPGTPQTIDASQATHGWMNCSVFERPIESW